MLTINLSRSTLPHGVHSIDGKMIIEKTDYKYVKWIALAEDGDLYTAFLFFLLNFQVLYQQGISLLAE
jgi:hypothetical protein